LSEIGYGRSSRDQSNNSANKNNTHPLPPAGEGWGEGGCEYPSYFPFNGIDQLADVFEASLKTAERNSLGGADPRKPLNLLLWDVA
jgi:hypothetical protein